MVSIIDNGTIGLTALALDAAVMRHQAIAQNIANANTPGYRPVDVRFEAQVLALLEAGPDLTQSAPAASLRPVVEFTDREVSLDSEMAKLAENTLRHQVLLKVLNKQLSLVAAAISEGKR